VLGPSGQRTRSRSSDSSGGGRGKSTGSARKRQTEWSPRESRPARPARAPQGKGTAAGKAGGTTTELEFRAGDKVQHGTFGPGVVVTSSLRDGEEEVTVAFTKGGVKKLLQSFARLESR
jgi:DNA helicase-2/ATP-dependent DNA helicase PcrA